MTNGHLLATDRDGVPMRLVWVPDLGPEREAELARLRKRLLEERCGTCQQDGETACPGCRREVEWEVWRAREEMEKKA